MSRWPDPVEDVLAGDQAVVLAYPTPASGAVLRPVTNFAAHDRETGTVTVNTSVGAWRKIDRIRRDPRVALAFHTRAHSDSERDEYVLLQGRARLTEPIENYPETVPSWERFDGPIARGPLWRRWLRVYHTRVGIEVSVHRVIMWPDLGCHGEPEVHGTPLPAEPAPQPDPANGTGPRVDHVREARKAATLPDVLLGWIGSDGFPMVVPVEITGTGEHGIALRTAASVVPPGGRRAGLIAHWFSRHVLGQNQRLHTGWLRTEQPGQRLWYAPHTKQAYRLPPSKLLYRVVIGFMTRLGLRMARRAGQRFEATSPPPA